MHIDWLTVSAQIVNFLVLVWLLQRFLYGPVVRAMDRREQRIRDRLDEAARSRASAAIEAERYREQAARLEHEREQALADAREQARQLRQTLTQEAREQVDAEQRQWQTQMQRERGAFLRNLRERATEQFISVARHGLADLAGAELEPRMASRLIDRLDGLDEATREHFRQAALHGGLCIRSRCDLGEEARRRLAEGLALWLGQSPAPRHETAEDAPWGIELVAGSHVVAWTVDSYVDDYVAALGRELDSGAPPP